MAFIVSLDTPTGNVNRLRRTNSPNLTSKVKQLAILVYLEIILAILTKFPRSLSERTVKTNELFLIFQASESIPNNLE